MERYENFHLQKYKLEEEKQEKKINHNKFTSLI